MGKEALARSRDDQLVGRLVVRDEGLPSPAARVAPVAPTDQVKRLLLVGRSVLLPLGGDGERCEGARPQKVARKHRTEPSSQYLEHGYPRDCGEQHFTAVQLALLPRGEVRNESSHG